MDTIVFNDLVLLQETARAYLVKDEGDNKAWIPKSQIINIEFGDNIEIDGMPAKEIMSLEIPVWLADKTELEE